MEKKEKEKKKPKVMDRFKPPELQLKFQKSVVDDIDDITFQMEPWLS